MRIGLSRTTPKMLILSGDVPFGPDYLFKGRKESSKLLDIAVPLSSAEDPRRLADPLIGILHTVLVVRLGRMIGTGTDGS